MMRVVFFVFFGLADMAGTMKRRAEIQLDFGSPQVKLVCPMDAQEWGTQSGDINKPNSDKVELAYLYEEDNKKIYYCKDGTEKYNFYFKGKICEKCFELNGMVLITIIIGDLLVTGGVILLVYQRAQRKPRSPAAAAANHQDTPGAPESNYEELSPRTRDIATYAGVQRTG